MEILCPKCKKGKMAHDGFHLGKQTYKCNNRKCRYRTTDLSKIPVTEYDKAISLKFQIFLSLRVNAKLIGASVNSVKKWLENPKESTKKFSETLTNKQILKYLSSKKKKFPELFTKKNKMGMQVFKYWRALTKDNQNTIHT